MKYEIETYKGQIIEYNDEWDKFYCDITVEDKYKNVKRGSLKDVRKEIDSFIKLNVDFKPFKAFVVSEYSNSDFEEVLVESIRTDGKLVVSQEGGSYKSHYGKKEMKTLRVYDAEISKEKNHLLKELKEHRDKVYQTIKELTEKTIPVDLTHLENFINQTNE